MNTRYQRPRSWTNIVALGVLAAITFCWVDSAKAGYLVQEAKVTRVANTSSNQAMFVVWVVGGTGTCAMTAGRWIAFPLSSAVDADVHKRAWSAALLALSSGMNVTIYNYANDDCYGASYIEIAP
jgi:hypothetical protein